MIKAPFSTAGLSCCVIQGVGSSIKYLSFGIRAPLVEKVLATGEGLNTELTLCYTPPAQKIRPHVTVARWYEPFSFSGSYFREREQRLVFVKSSNNPHTHKTYLV
mgnify:CR=1 FL=1